MTQVHMNSHDLQELLFERRFDDFFVAVAELSNRDEVGVGVTRVKWEVAKQVPRDEILSCVVSLAAS